LENLNTEITRKSFPDYIESIEKYILDIMNIVSIVEEPEISFPQADSFKRVINLCELLLEARDNQMTNIETVLVDENGLNLPEEGCDLIFLRNAFHHIEDPACYFKTLKRFPKPRGKVVIIDYKKRAVLNFITLMGPC